MIIFMMMFRTIIKAYYSRNHLREVGFNAHTLCGELVWLGHTIVPSCSASFKG